MTTVAQPVPRTGTGSRSAPLPYVATALAFAILFWDPVSTLARDWWTDPDAAHGLLLFPIAAYLAWRAGVVAKPSPQRRLGLTILVGAVLLRYLSGLAAELFTMRASLIGAFAGLVMFEFGWSQVKRWWLPFALVCLSVPIPAVVLNSLALPLQLKASAMGAALLRTRNVPVLLEGNVLHLPDRSLFVTEACSGLRSLAALIALGILIGGLWLRTAWSRLILVMTTIPVGMLVNSIRVFLTGFLVYYVNPRLADGFSHYTEGWALFVVAFAVLGGLAWALRQVEQRGPAVSVGPSVLEHRAPTIARWLQGTSGQPITAQWGPAAVLAVAVLMTVGVAAPAGRALSMPLAEALPRQLSGFQGRDVAISDEERRVAGVTDYFLRSYAPAGSATDGLSVYVGYYDSQTQGKTIHSPKNCLPGSGWQALQSSTTTIRTTSGPATVNRYLIQKGSQQALVLYWYQGRGRIQANEYAVKWNLLRDAAVRRRSEEALVRIVVPITDGLDAALSLARGSAERLVGDLERALPS